MKKKNNDNKIKRKSKEIVVQMSKGAKVWYPFIGSKMMGPGDIYMELLL